MVAKVVTSLCSFILFGISLAYDKPNILLIVADDMGWNDVSFHGSYQIPTPNIDALAKDGIILNNYYVSPICTPSRGSLFSGQYSIRIGLQHFAIADSEPWGLPSDVKIMPQYFRELGYTTRAIGKWHLGFFTRDHLPTRKGFDSFFGYYSGDEDYYSHLSEDAYEKIGYDLHDDVGSKERVAWEYRGNYSTELFTNKAIDIIETHNSSNKPLFMYLGYQAVHAGNEYHPLEPPPDEYVKFDYIKDPERRKFAGMLYALDVAIGRVFASLEKSGMLDNTLIVFTSDNGAAVQGVGGNSGSNWPLRGCKFTLWEGGVRANGFVWSSNLRKKSRIDETLFHITDWLPTLYTFAGGNVNDLLGIDGVNQWRALDEGSPSGRDTILHNIDPIWEVSAIRKGSYKLVAGSWNATYDNWFDRNGKLMQPWNEDVGDSMPSEFEIEDQYKTAQTVGVLTRAFGDDYKYIPSKERRVEIDCGSRPKNFYGNCDPMDGPCLFNINKDPCEFTNIAARKPKVTKELQDLLQKYSREAIDPANKGFDPRADPKYSGGAWLPWVSIR